MTFFHWPGTPVKLWAFCWALSISVEHLKVALSSNSADLGASLSVKVLLGSQLYAQLWEPC